MHFVAMPKYREKLWSKIVFLLVEFFILVRSCSSVECSKKNKIEFNAESERVRNGKKK